MIGKWVSYKDSETWFYGEVIDLHFSQKDNTWLFFLALCSVLKTRLVIVPFEKIKYEDMRKYNEKTNTSTKIQ